ncbi:MAG: hypothetical protein U0575_14900 [Phycisphaerales bacterium]
MNNALHWIKTNLAIVVLGGVMVVAIVLAIIFSGRWNDAIREEAALRARKLPEIQQLQKTPVNLTIPGKPPVQMTATVNPTLLREYERLTGELREDARKVRELAVAHNRKDRGVLIPRLFPEMPFVEKDTLPPEMYEETLKAFRELLRSVNAGAPPTADEVATALLGREEQYISSTLRKQARKDLDAQETKDLSDELSRARLALYGETAKSISVYASLDALPLPPASLKAAATPSQMFDWQWNYWIASDILRAIGAANTEVSGPKGSVVMNPVKQVISLRILNPIPVDSATSGTSSGFGGAGGPGGRQAPNFGSMNPGGAQGPSGGDGAAGGAATGAPAGPGEALDPGKEAPLDYKVSFTGRVTNQLYDVRNVELRLVVSMERLPVIMDALARENFMTVLDLELRPADPFAAAALGYIYGNEPVAEATFLIETIWLREWTSQFMPQKLREMMKVVLPSAKNAPAAGTDPNAPPADGLKPPG